MSHSLIFPVSVPASARRRVGWCLLLLSGGLAVSPLAEADDLLPKAPPVSKYAKMAAHSPFAPPSAQVAPQATPPPPPVPGWADSLTATMIMQDGPKYLVTVVDSASPQHLYLTSETPADKPNDIAVASVKWGANREDPPTITLRKGKEFAQVRYESGAASPGGNNALGGAAPGPGALRNPTGGPVIPGSQAFHPPLQPSAAQPNNPGGPTSNAIRRPLIRAQPAAPAGGRPGINPPNTAVRPNPALQNDDDDDD